jgi:diaminopimelate decarboxylase
VPDVFDKVWSTPSWPALDLEAHATALADRMAQGAWYLPTTARETLEMAERLAPADRLLAPSPEALRATAGPTPAVADRLSVAVPATLSVQAPVEALHAFGRRHNWTLWVRAPDGARRPLTHWEDFDACCEALAPHAPRETLYLQRRVQGTALDLAFVAADGTLLDARTAVAPHPEAQTEPVGHPASLSPSLQAGLVDAVEALGWTGGARLRLVADDDATYWLEAWHPCLPPDEASASQDSPNLPARLVTACIDSADASVASRSPNASPAWHTLPHTVDAPSLPPGLRPSSAHRLAGMGNGPTHLDDGLDDDLRAVVDDLPPDWRTVDTPHATLLPTRTQERFRAFASAADRAEAALDLDAAHVGLSIKTNPSGALLDAARNAGLLAETIHPDEMAHARSHGYALDEIIVNGPVQALLPDLRPAPFALFGDAVSDLEDLPFDPSGTILGVRTRPPERGDSRFGVDLSDEDAMDRLCAQVRRWPASTQLGLHLHAPASTLGIDRWWRCLARVLQWADTLQTRTGRPVEALDLGGGWHPDDWLDVFIPGLLHRGEALHDALPALRTLLFEPGKALSQPLGVVVSRVLDARPERGDVVLDASIAELSNIDYHPHRLLAHTDRHGWHRLPRGDGRLLGRLCMEADILGRRRAVDHLAPGDTVVVCDAGAYDRSMTYPFGQGAATG